MTDSSVVVFRALDPALNRSTFDCGNEAITRWFRQQAGQQERRDSVRTHVGLATLDGSVASFFSLVVHQIDLTEAASSLAFAHRRYPIPAVLIAQLAVDRRYQGRGIGALTLGHAIRVLSDSSMAVGFELVTVDAIDDSAARFYKRFGFTPLVDGGERLFITTKQLRASIESM